MGDREKILEAIRQAKRRKGEEAKGQSPSLVEFVHSSVPLDELLSKAREMVVAVGGVVMELGSEEEQSREIREGELVVQGEFLVAENGAIWVEPAPEMERSALFLAEHLVIQVSAKEVVPTMHEAYERLQDRDFSYGTFISGPSKTADIEQSLVIGAQGPKSCLVILT